MAKNDIFLIDGILEDRKNNALPSSDDGEVFEFFSVEQYFKDFNVSNEDLQSCSTDGELDGGIDYILIFLNGNIIQDLDDIIIPPKNASIELYFVTCKHSSSFKQATLDAIIPTLNELFDFLNPIDIGKYNKKIISARKTIYELYKKAAPSLSTLEIKVIYSCRAEDSINMPKEIMSRAEQIIKIINSYFDPCISDVVFLGADKLLNLYRRKPNYDLTLSFSKIFNSNNCYVGLTTIKNYYNFITDDNHKLMYHLFDANVRDFMNNNDVNQDILNTLENSNDIDFWLLNNGITLLVDNISAIGDTLNLKNVQIINGLQTSYSIFNYFSANTNMDDDRQILIRIIKSNDIDIRDNIIRSTNNQTPINISSLHATDKIQRDIEAILKKHGMYYNRKTKYYENLGIATEDLVKPIDLAKMYATLILKLPYRAISLKTKFMSITDEYNAVFNDKTNINLWVVLARLSKSSIEYLKNIKSDIGKLQKFYSTIKHIMTFLSVSLYYKNFAFTVKDILEINISRLENDCYDIVWKFLYDNNILEHLSECKSKKYLEVLFTKFSNNYAIDNISAFTRAKNILKYDRMYKLDQSFIDKVLNTYQTAIENNIDIDQIRKYMLDELRCDPQKINQAVSLLKRQNIITRNF